MSALRPFQHTDIKI